LKRTEQKKRPVMNFLVGLQQNRQRQFKASWEDADSNSFKVSDNYYIDI
jgi:hypothetical protein